MEITQDCLYSPIHVTMSSRNGKPKYVVFFIQKTVTDVFLTCINFF